MLLLYSHSFTQNSDITKTAGTSKPSQAASPKPENVGLRRNFQKKKGGGKKKKGGW